MAGKVSFSGGEKLQKVFKEAGKGGVKALEIGVFASSRYPDGTPVASVAAWNEFGTKHIPERPALRIANKENEKVLLAIIKRGIDPLKMVITPQLAGRLGANHKGAMQKSIINLREPPNVESTIRAKGSSNPLVGKDDLYNKSIDFKVIK